MAIYFFDKNQTLMKIVPESATFEAIQTQELDDDSLLKDTLSVTVKGDEKLLNAEYMAVKSYKGNAQTFDMYRIVTDTTPDKSMSFTGMSLAPYELNGHIIQDFRLTNQTISYTLNRVLDGTDWRVGYIEDGLSNVTTTFYYVSAKEALKELQSLVGCEFVFKVEISGQKITDKWIEVYSEMGNRTKKRFNYGTNALTVVRETNKADIFTALIGRGKGEEVTSAGENESGQAGYGRKITFEDIEWSTANGNPLDKPIGQYYLELPQATQVYGIKNIDGTMKARVGIVDFDDEEDKNRVINLTYQQLLVSSRPKVLFKTTVANVGATGIGDTVTIHRHDLNIHYQTRVRKIVRNKLNDNKTQVELGDAVVTPSTKQTKQNNATIKNLNSEIEKIKANVTTSQNSADGKNTIFYGSAEPDVMRTGDTWYRPHPSIAGETQMLTWNGTSWELVIDTSDLTSVSREVKDAIDKAEEAKLLAVSEAENALAQAKADATTKANAIKEQISGEVNTAISTAEDAKALAVSEAENALAQAKADATAKANAVKTEVSNSVNTAINTANDAKQTAVNNYTNAVAEAERLDGVQKTAFDNRFTTIQNSVDTFNQSVGDVDAKAGDAIEKAGANANLLTTHKNTIDTIIEDLDNLQVGGRNYALKSNVYYYTTDYKVAEYDLAKIPKGTKIKISIWGGLSTNVRTFGVYINNSLGWPSQNSQKIELTKLDGLYGQGAYTAMNKWTGEATLQVDASKILIYGLDNDTTSPKRVEYVKVETGGAFTDWTQAQEDTLGKVEFQTFKGTYENNDQLIKSRLLAIDSGKEGSIAYRLNETESTAEGNTNTISDIKKKPGEQIVGYQTIKERSDLYERVIGKDEAGIKSNMARMVMTDSLFKTEVIKNVPSAIGGRNYVLKSNDYYYTTDYKVSEYDLSTIPKGTKIKISLWGGLSSSVRTFGVYVNNSSGLQSGNSQRVELTKQSGLHGQGAYTTLEKWTAEITLGVDAKKILIYGLDNNNTAPKRVEYVQIETGDYYTDWSPAPEDKASMSAITQLADAIDLKVSDEELLSRINVQAGGILITSGTNKLNITPETTFIEDATIKSAMIDTVNVKKISGTSAEFTSMVTGALTANTITSTMLNADEAMFTKLFATSMATDKLVAQGAWITNANIVSLDAGTIKSGTIDSARIDAGYIVTNGLSTNVIKSEHINATVALVNKIFSQEAYIKALTSKTIFASQIKAIEIDASKITSGELDAARIKSIDVVTQGLTADAIQATHIKAEAGLVDKLFSKTAYIEELTNKTVFTEKIQAININADKITSGTLDASKVSVVNLDANNITANKTEFVRTAWNDINSEVAIDGSGIKTTNINGDFSRIVSGELRSFNANSSSTAILGSGRSQYFDQNGSQFILGKTLHGNNWINDGTLQVTYNRRFAIGRYADYAVNNGIFHPYIALEYAPDKPGDEPNGIVRLYKAVYLQKGINAGNNDIGALSKISFYNGGLIESQASTSNLLITASNKMVVYAAGTNAFEIDSGYMYLRRNLSMEGNNITNQSDRRLKTNIVDTPVDSLSAISNWGFKAFDRVNNRSHDDIGLIAQDTSEIVVYDEENDIYNVNSSKQIMMNSHGIQQLNTKVDDEITQLKAQIASLQDELAQLKGA